MADKNKDFSTNNQMTRRRFLKGAAFTTAVLSSGIGAAELAGHFIKDRKMTDSEDLVFQLSRFMENYKSAKGLRTQESSAPEVQKARRTAISVALKHVAEGDVKLDPKIEESLDIYVNPSAGANYDTFAFSLDRTGSVRIIDGAINYYKFMGQEYLEFEQGTSTEERSKLSPNELTQFADKLVDNTDVHSIDFAINYSNIEVAAKQELPKFAMDFILKNVTPSLAPSEWRNPRIKHQTLSLIFINGFSMEDGSIGPEIAMEHRIYTKEDVYYPWTLKIDVARLNQIKNQTGRLDIDTPFNAGLNAIMNDMLKTTTNPEWWIIPPNETMKLFDDYLSFLRGRVQKVRNPFEQSA